jgi:peroxiredoxin
VAAAQGYTSLAIGSDIPKAGLKRAMINGGQVSLNDAKTRKGLLVMFSCNTCPYVIKSQARTKEMMEYAKKRGIGMVIVNSNEAQRDDEDSPEAMKAYAGSQGYNIPYLNDVSSELANAFGATRTPEVFLFDGNGKLVYKGAMEDNPSNPSESKQIFLKAAIDNLVDGKPIDPNTTKSIGCGIKRVS